MRTIFIVFLLAGTGLIRAEAVPTDDPAAEFDLSWTGGLHWNEVVDISTMPGANADTKLAAAQKELAAKGGGVVFFPAGEYRFRESIQLLDGIVLRGVPPTGEQDARKNGYRLASRIEFPKFAFQAKGKGTPVDAAFKAIALAEPAKASNCGMVHLAINRGHIKFSRAPGDGGCGRNRLVLGCVLTNTAYADPAVPDETIGQKPWQRFTWRFGAAIDAHSHEHLLIANNRIPKSGQDNFAMDGYVLRGRKKERAEVDGVVFDYDNRPGIYANHESLGGPGGQGPNGTPESHPHGFRKGVVIRGNFVFATGRCAIGFSGDGTICSGNVIRFEKDVWRPTNTGRQMTSGASTNDNRALEMRGWRWVVENNDYEVYRNWAHDRKYLINDGEGLMHEDHANCAIKDSVLRGNKGNAYLSLYKTAGIDGLVVEGNEVPNIMVVSDRNSGRFPICKVRIEDNITHAQKNAIHVAGEPSQNVVVRGNRNAGGGEAVILNLAKARLERNTGYREVRKGAKDR